MAIDSENTLHAKEPSLGKRIITGGMVLSVARVMTKALTGVCSLIIPRWLGPTEMGLFGVALLVLAAIDAFTQSGFVAAFIQRKNDYQKCILPVRTFNAIRGLLIGLFIFVTAPYIAHFMYPPLPPGSDPVEIQKNLLAIPRLTNVLRGLSLLPFITGLTPMIWTLADKYLRFGYAAKYNVGMAAFRFLVMIPFAWYFRSVWVLVIGELIIAATGVIVSTLMGKEGRGFTLDLSPLRELRNFGFWIFLSNIAGYIYTQGGSWAIGRLLNVDTLAVYQLAFVSCTMITRETAGIINQMILPTFSHLQKDLPRLRSGFKKSFGLIAMLVVGTGSLCCVLAHDYFTIVLTGKWAAHATLFNQFVPWLALWGVCVGLSGAQSGVLQALGKPNLWLYSLIAMCALMFLFIWPAFHFFGAVGIAALLGGIGALMQLVRYAIMARMLKMRLGEVLEHVVVPVMAGILSVTAATLLRKQFFINPWGQAIVAGSTVSIVYVGILLACSRFMNPNLPLLLTMIRDTLKERLQQRQQKASGNAC